MGYDGFSRPGDVSAGHVDDLSPYMPSCACEERLAMAAASLRLEHALII